MTGLSVAEVALCASAFVVQYTTLSIFPSYPGSSILVLRSGTVQYARSCVCVRACVRVYMCVRACVCGFSLQWTKYEGAKDFIDFSTYRYKYRQ